jgi:type II secretory pathway component PulF
VDDIKEEADRTARKVARGRSETTPVLVHNVLFVVIATFVGLVVLAVLLIYFFA